MPSLSRSISQSILQSARISELRSAAALVGRTRPPVQLPRNGKRKSARLLMLLAAERRRNAALIATIGD